MSVAAKVPGVWHRTTARPGSRACDGCKRRPRAGAGIAYRTHATPGKRADLLCEPCARSEPSHDADGRETERSIWDEARPSSTPEARGQECLGADGEGRDRLLAAGWRPRAGRWYPPGVVAVTSEGGGFTMESALRRLDADEEPPVDLTPELEAAEVRHRDAIERVGKAYEKVASATEEAETAAAELHTSARALDRIRTAMRDVA